MTRAVREWWGPGMRPERVSEDTLADELGGLISHRAVAEREPLSESATVAGRALMAYTKRLRTLRHAARVLPRHHVYRDALARETIELRAARRRSSYARMALVAGEFKP